LTKKRILLIGGAGTLGSDILDANLAEFELFVLDDFSESALTESEVKQKCNYRNESVANEIAVSQVFQDFQPDVVVYLATTLSSNQVRAYESNLLGMSNTIKAAEKNKLPIIIYVQSFLTRNSEQLIDKNSPVEARDPYSTWKLASEYLLDTYLGPKTTLILASVLSQRLSVGAVPAFAKRIENQKQIRVTETYRDYIDSQTFISGLIEIIDCGLNGVQVLGSGQPIRTLDILAYTAEVLGLTLENINYVVVAPRKSDPERIALANDFSDKLIENTSDVQVSIGRIVANHIRSKKEVRLHH